jgi:hypothetical protein
MKPRIIALAIASLAVACPWTVQSQTSASIGIEYSEGKYGSADKTSSITVPVSIKHEAGAWTFKASIPYMWSEGAFSRDAGVPSDCLRRSGTEIDDECVAAAGGGGAGGKERQSGIGDLTLGVFRNVVETKGGLLIDLGVKAKLATADKKKTLLTSGENDYAVQIDLMQSLNRDLSLLGTLGFLKKGDTPTVDYSDPIFGSLGASLALGGGGSVGVAWDFREKTTALGDPISEVSLFYTTKLGADRKLNVYVLTGLSDGSPDMGGGVVFTQRF